MIERRALRRRPPARSAALVGAAVTALLFAAGCSGDSGNGSASGGTATGGSGASCPSPTAAPASETALLPSGLSFDKIGTVTDVSKAGGQLTVKAVASKPLEELTVLIQDAVTAAGYRPSGMDNEGDEAEVFFTSGSLAAGQARIERAGCEGSWDIDLTLLDPDALPSPTATT